MLIFSHTPDTRTKLSEHPFHRHCLPRVTFKMSFFWFSLVKLDTKLFKRTKIGPARLVCLTLRAGGPQEKLNSYSVQTKIAV